MLSVYFTHWLASAYEAMGDLFERSKERDGRIMWNGWGRGELGTWIGWENQTEKDHLDNLGVNGRTVLKWISKDEGA